MIGDMKFEVGMAREEDDPMPPDDYPYTWHVHEPPIQVEIPAGAFLSPWGTGIKCDGCAKEKPVHDDGKRINWAISRLKNTNEAGVTQSEMRQEIYANARADGRDITRV